MLGTLFSEWCNSNTICRENYSVCNDIRKKQVVLLIFYIIRLCLQHEFTLRNTTKVEKYIYKFLDDNGIENWNTFDITKQILSTYLIVDTESDAEIISNL